MISAVSCAVSAARPRPRLCMRAARTGALAPPGPAALGPRVRMLRTRALAEDTGSEPPEHATNGFAHTSDEHKDVEKPSPAAAGPEESPEASDELEDAVDVTSHAIVEEVEPMAKEGGEGTKPAASGEAGKPSDWQSADPESNVEGWTKPVLGERSGLGIAAGVLLACGLGSWSMAGTAKHLGSIRERDRAAAASASAARTAQAARDPRGAGAPAFARGKGKSAIEEEAEKAMQAMNERLDAEAEVEAQAAPPVAPASAAAAVPAMLHDPSPHASSMPTAIPSPEPTRPPAGGEALAGVRRGYTWSEPQGVYASNGGRAALATEAPAASGKAALADISPEVDSALLGGFTVSASDDLGARHAAVFAPATGAAAAVAAPTAPSAVEVELPHRLSVPDPLVVVPVPAAAVPAVGSPEAAARALRASSDAGRAAAEAAISAARAADLARSAASAAAEASAAAARVHLASTPGELAEAEEASAAALARTQELRREAAVEYGHAASAEESSRAHAGDAKGYADAVARGEEPGGKGWREMWARRGAAAGPASPAAPAAPAAAAAATPGAPAPHAPYAADVSVVDSVEVRRVREWIGQAVGTTARAGAELGAEYGPKAAHALQEVGGHAAGAARGAGAFLADHGGRAMRGMKAATAAAGEGGGGAEGGVTSAAATTVSNRDGARSGQGRGRGRGPGRV